jgi:predicted transcriptional regulator
MTEENGGRTSYPTSFWLDDESKALLVGLVADLDMNRSAVVREAIRRMATDPQMTEVRRLVRELEKVVSGA